MTRSRTLFVLIGSLSAAFAAGTTHLVVSGDTLWDITGKYLGDPFKWPSVWQKNPQIADAHWIYPGDTVHIETGDTPAVPDTSVASSPNSSDPLADFLPSTSTGAAIKQDTSPLVMIAESPAQSFLNLDAMRLAPVHLMPGEVASVEESGLDWSIEGGRHMIRPGTVIGTSLGSDKGVAEGQWLEIVERDERVLRLNDPELKGRYEQVRGLCQVIELRQDSSSCMMRKVYGDAGIHAIARVYTPLEAHEVTSFEPVEETESARVIANTRNSRLQLPGSYVIIDRGRDASVSEGDIVEFMAAGNRRGLASMRGYGIVVRSVGSSSTVFMVGVRQSPVLVGDRAWRIRRAIGPG